MWPFTRRVRQAEGGRRSFASSLWSPRGDHSLAGSEGIFAAVTRLADTLASTPFNLYKGAEIAWEDPRQRLVSYMAAPGVTPFGYLSGLEAGRDTRGNGYALKVPSPGGITEQLDVLDPYCVEPLRDIESGEMYYKLTPQNGGTFYIHWREMIHVRQVTTGGLSGVSPITVLKDALEYDDQMKAFSVQQAKGVGSSVVLEFTNTNLGKPQKDEIIAEFMEHYEKSRGNLIVLGSGSKANVLSRSPVDSKVLDVERVTKGRIAAVYRMPPHMLGNFDHASYGSNEQQMLEFLQLTMYAVFKQYEHEHNLKLLTYEEYAKGWRFGFATDEMIIPTVLQKAQASQYLIRSSVRTPNELRKRDGSPPDPDGDVLMASRDLVPLKTLVHNPERIGRVL